MSMFTICNNLNQILSYENEVETASEFFEVFTRQMMEELTPVDVPKFDQNEFVKEEADKEKMFVTSSPTIISRLFSGLFVEWLTCQNHPNPQPISEFFTQEVLELEMESSLGESLTEHFEESVEKKMCKICKKKTQHSRFVKIQYAPPVLAL